MTTKAEIEVWFDRGVTQEASYMLVICDTFDWDDYPVYVSSADEAKKRRANPGEMQKFMELYDLSADKQTQLGQTRANNL